MRVLIYPDLKSQKGIPYSRNHLRRLWQRGDFPKPRFLSKRMQGWSEEVIDDWLRQRLEDNEAA